MPPRRRARPVVLAAVVLLAVCACGGDDGAGDGATASSSTTVTTAASTEPTTTPTEPTTTGSRRPTAFTTTARDAINELEAAWRAGDRSRAEAIAPGDAVDALFHLAPEGFEVYGCDTGEFETSTCNLRNRSTGVVIGVTAVRHEGGWQVATLNVSEG